jgi:squalene-associated FAD-dependent desaturase
MTWSFEHNGISMDNGQHVFLRCCSEYTSFVARLGATDEEVRISGPLDIPVVAPSLSPGKAPRVGRIKRTSMSPPFHLLGSLARYPYLSPRDRLGLGRAVFALRRLDLDDPSLDAQSFGSWLRSHGQSTAAIRALWDLITVPTVNLPAEEASLAMAAMVFRTGLLSESDAGDIGWSRVPLGALHGDRAARALDSSGASVHTSTRVTGVRDGPPGRYTVATEDGSLECDAVVVAVAHLDAGSILPDHALARQEQLAALGSSAVVDVHLVFDRRVTDWDLMAAHDSAVQWVFDRSDAAGLGSDPRGPQYLAVSLSAADSLLSRRPDDLVSEMSSELARLLPRAREARLLDSFVTKERQATFRAEVGSALLRPVARTRYPALAVAGAWTDTGWPATMEGAVRSGRRAAFEVIGDLTGRREQPADRAGRTASTAYSQITKEVA